MAAAGGEGLRLRARPTLGLEVAGERYRAVYAALAPAAPSGG